MNSDTELIKQLPQWPVYAAETGNPTVDGFLEWAQIQAVTKEPIATQKEQTSE